MPEETAHEQFSRVIREIEEMDKRIRENTPAKIRASIYARSEPFASERKEKPLN